MPENFLERAGDMRDAVRYSRQIRMHGNRHDLCALRGFRVEAAELIERARVHHVGWMVLQCHQHDIVNLEIVGQRHHRAVRGFQRHRLVVEHPVADIFDPGLGEVVERIEGLG